MKELIALIIGAGITPLISPDLSVKISGIKEQTGTIMIAVYQSKETFLTKEVYKWSSIEVSEAVETATIDIPFGSYAISIYHDLDDDGELDRNLFGIPSEPTGFSNNARGVLGTPPGFEDAKFEFSSGNTSATIQLSN